MVRSRRSIASTGGGSAGGRLAVDGGQVHGDLGVSEEGQDVSMADVDDSRTTIPAEASVAPANGGPHMPTVAEDDTVVAKGNESSALAPPVNSRVKRLTHKRVNGSRDLGKGRKSLAKLSLTNGTAKDEADGKKTKRSRLSDGSTDSLVFAPKRRKREGLPVEEFIPLDQLPTGFVFVSGSNDSGESGRGLGQGSTETLFRLKIFDQDVVKIASGSSHNLVLLQDGEVWSWGVNDLHACGRPSKNDEGEDLTMTPAPVVGLDTVLGEANSVYDIAAGDSISVVLTKKGLVYAWGTFTTEEADPLFSPGVKYAERPTLVAGLEGVEMKKIACGGNHVIGLDSQGNVWTWGLELSGRLLRKHRSKLEANPEDTLTPQIVIRSLGTRSTRNRVVNIAAGPYSTYVIFEDGSVKAGGIDNYGQVGLLKNGQAGERMSVKLPLDVIHVAAGEHHAIFQTADGQIYGLGRCEGGQLGLGEEAIARKDVRGEALPIPMPDSIVCAPCKVQSGLRWNAAIGTNGEIVTWGFNPMGQLALGPIEQVNIPTRVNINTRKAMQLSCGSHHLLALLSDRQE